MFQLQWKNPHQSVIVLHLTFIALGFVSCIYLLYLDYLCMKLLLSAINYTCCCGRLRCQKMWTLFHTGVFMTWRCWPKAGLASSTEVNTRTGELLLTRSSRLASSDLSHGWCITSGSSKLQPDPRWAFFQFSLFVQCNQCNSSAPSSHCSRICILRFSKFKKCVFTFSWNDMSKNVENDIKVSEWLLYWLFS